MGLGLFILLFFFFFWRNLFLLYATDAYWAGQLCDVPNCCGFNPMLESKTKLEGYLGIHTQDQTHKCSRLGLLEYTYGPGGPWWGSIWTVHAWVRVRVRVHVHAHPCTLLHLERQVLCLFRSCFKSPDFQCEFFLFHLSFLELCVRVWIFILIWCFYLLNEILPLAHQVLPSLLPALLLWVRTSNENSSLILSASTCMCGRVL